MKLLIYQVLPRLFGNEKNNPVSNGGIDENGCGKMSAFTPRTLKEIKSMGFTHIWYTGLLEHATQTDYTAYGIKKDHAAVVKGKAGSPYAIKDYYDIDPDLADNVADRMKEFERLVADTHKAKLKMIMDFVPNHVAREYESDAKPAGVVDLGANDDTNTSFSVDNNFYYIPGQSFTPQFPLDVNGEVYQEFPAKATGNDCFHAYPSRNDWYETVKLNYGIDFLNGWQRHFDPVPNTWKKMLDILLFWASKKVDGFRCDMAEMVPVEFWNWAISAVKAKYPNIVFIAEVYNPNEYRNYLHTGKFDYLYDKVGLYDTLKGVIRSEIPARNITYCWQSVDDIQDQMLNFLENHDEQRIASDFFAGDPRKALPALVVSATMNKSPFMLYFGQELGERGMDEEGFSGRDGRTTIFDYWGIESIQNWRNKGELGDTLLSESQKELRQFHIRLLQLCSKSKAIQQGLFFDLMYLNLDQPYFNSDKQYAYLRYEGNELLLIVANFDSQDVETQVYIPAFALDYFGIHPQAVSPSKDLLSDKKITARLEGDSLYPVSISAHNAAILKFAVKK